MLSRTSLAQLSKRCVFRKTVGGQRLSSNTPSSKKAETVAEEEDWFNTASQTHIEERIVPKPVSVMPDHLPQVRRRQVQKPWWKFRYFVDINTPPIDLEEHTSTPQYPPIFDSTPSGTRKQIRMEWYKAIGRLPTAEEKLYEITKHYGHLSYLIEPVMKQYNFLPIQQHITQTRLINSLPEQYQLDDNTTIDENLKQAILATIASRLFETKSRKPSLEFKVSSLPLLGHPTSNNSTQTSIEEDILADVVRLVKSSHNNSNHFLVDYNPHVAFSWWLKDCPIPFKKKRWFPEDFCNQAFKYESTHGLHVRSPMPLPHILPINDQQCLEPLEVEANYNIFRQGVPLIRRNIVSLPGFWLDRSEGYSFGNLLCHTREQLRARKDKNESDFGDDQDVLDGMAILSSFAWLSSLASDLGFSVYHPITYPLVTNVIVTDGQRWSFYVYQLNNQAFHSDINQDEIQRHNICWSSGDLQLFESFENGELKGVNDKVLKLLVKMINTAEVEEVDYPLRPYLGQDLRSQQDKDQLSYSLRRKFANVGDTFIARRKKTNLWETIYKEHKDAPQDVKRVRPKIDMQYPPYFK